LHSSGFAEGAGFALKGDAHGAEVQFGHFSLRALVKHLRRGDASYNWRSADDGEAKAS
jgi:hypothetical protein